jgi:folate-binding protein YgfZ
VTAVPVLPPGAVLAGDPPDEGLAAHFGDPYAEQRALSETVAAVARPNLDHLVVSGADRLGWLHNLTSQHVESLPPGRLREALVLSPHGHIEHHLLVHDDATRTHLELEPGTGEELRRWLDSMRFLLRVEVGPADLAVLTLAGPESGQVLAGLGLPRPAPGEVLEAGGVTVRDRSWPAGGVDLVAPPDRAAEVYADLREAGVRPAGIWALEALRVLARRPRLGFETDHRTIPHEVGWLDAAVHLDKGCYRGQETVARVHNLGRPPRRLVLLHLDGGDSPLPPHGTPVTWDGAAVGFVTTSARHFEAGPVALALVKRTTPDTAPLKAGALDAAIDPD